MLATLVLLCAAVGGEGAALRLREGPLEKVLQEAKEQDRPVLLELDREGPGGPGPMDREVLADAEVVAFCNGNFVVYRVDPGKGEGPALREKYGAAGDRTFVLLGPDGAVLDRQVGGAPREEFLALLKDIRAGNTFEALPGRIGKAPEDGALRLSYGRALLRRERTAEAREQFEKAVALDPEDAEAGTVEARMALAFLDAEARDSAEPLKAFAAKYAASPWAVPVHRALVRRSMGSHDLDGALASMAFLEDRGVLDLKQRCHYAFLLATEKKEGAKALAIAEDAAKRSPDEVYPLMARAFALSALGRHEEAVATAKEAVEKAPPEMKQEGQGFVERITKARDEAKAKEEEDAKGKE